MNKLLLENYRWWNKTHKQLNKVDLSDTDDYDDHLPNEWISISKEGIKEDNPSYDMDLLIKLNKWVITVDSQENMIEIVDEKSNTLNHHYCKYLADERGFQYDELKKNRILENYQKPYLELITNIENGKSIWKNFKNSKDYGIIMTTKIFTRTNKTIDFILNNEKNKFHFKNFISLTWQRIKNPVNNTFYDKKTDLIISTTIPIDYSEYKSRATQEKSNDFCHIFIVGKDCSLKINNLFKKLIDIFDT